MRIRFKPWARPELEASYFYEDIPEEYIGKWKEKFKNQKFKPRAKCPRLFMCFI